MVAAVPTEDDGVGNRDEDWFEAPDDTDEEGGLLDLLRTMADGLAVEQLDAMLAKVVDAVRHRGTKGQLRITLDIERKSVKTGELEVKLIPAAKVPGKGYVATRYPTKSGRLRVDPDEPGLFAVDAERESGYRP
jgi:hypothetical protein